jgi:hypothetical protein
MLDLRVSDIILELFFYNTRIAHAAGELGRLGEMC